METDIIKIIDNAISKVLLMGAYPSLINLTEKDYSLLTKKCKLQTRKGEDYADGYIKDLEYYKGKGYEIEIDCRVLDKDEANEIHPMFSESYICSSSKFVLIGVFIPKKTLIGRIKDLFVPKEVGRGFNLRTLKEIL